jgi:hypothetical protein
MSALAVGTVLRSPSEFDRVPIGTVITPTNGSRQEFVKKTDGWYLGDRLFQVNDFSMGYNLIKSMPKGSKVTWESLAQWQWRYRDNCYLSAENAGVSTAVVTGVMDELGITDDQFPLGRGVLLSNSRDRERLAIGAQVKVGNPETVSGFGLFVKSPTGWTHLLGDVNRPDGHRVLVITGDEVEWATTPGTEAEQVDLANFKARAWRVGWKVKLSHRWCESYEQYMGRIGLTEDVLRDVVNGGLSIGEKTTPPGAAALPAGSLLRWHHRSTPDTFTWYIRDDTMNNESRTRAIFGHRADGGVLRNSGSTMEVMHIANDEEVMNVEVDNLDAIFQYLPAGTRLRAGGGEYVLCHDRRITNWSGAVPNTGSWGLGQLGDTVTIAGFPS